MAGFLEENAGDAVGVLNCNWSTTSSSAVFSGLGAPDRHATGTGVRGIFEGSGNRLVEGESGRSLSLRGDGTCTATPGAAAIGAVWMGGDGEVGLLVLGATGEVLVVNHICKRE